MLRSKIWNKSGKNPETLSEQIPNFQVSYGWRIPNPENEADSLPKLVSELCYPPSTVGTGFFFGRAPSMEQLIVMKFLTVLGARLSKNRYWQSFF